MVRRHRPRLKCGARFDQEIPRAADMAFGRLQVADREAQREAFAQLRVRQKHVAVLVDQIDEALVGGVEVAPGTSFAPPGST